MAYNFPGSYYHVMDRGYFVESDNNVEQPIRLPDGEEPWNLDLGPKQVGQSLNPFQHQLQALNAKIKEGASRMEFGFFGAGKGSKERATPESFDSLERAEMRALAEVNKVRTTTHATVGVEGLAGFNGQKGFDEQTRDQAMTEIRKAIDFASEATTGGAVVFHTGEWQRPIYDSWKQDKVNGELFQFEHYEEEKERAPIMVVDQRTGELMAMRKDTKLYEPEFKTVEDYEQEQGVKLIGTTDPNTGAVYESGDWIGENGHAIKRDWEFDTKHTSEMFLRVPKWNPDKRNFKTDERDWDYFLKRSKEWNQRHDEKLTPEEIFAKTQYMNQVLQSKGSALYYAQRYETDLERLKALKDSLKYYDELDQVLPEEEKFRLMTSRNYDYRNNIIPPKSMPIKEYLQQEIKEAENAIRHVHEASAAADVQTRKAEDAMKNVKTVHDYGIKKSAQTMAQIGEYLWEKYEANKDHLKEPLYLAPENWHPNNFGSHPDELVELIGKGREEMARRLTPRVGPEEAKKLAKKHLKTTLDTGHLNLWKNNLKRHEGEDQDHFNKRFARWAVGKIENLHKEGMLGHIHLTDNFGYDDEHLTPGRGNAPVRELVTFLKEKGYGDFIVEGGSFNPTTVLHDTWARMGSPVYNVSMGGGGGHGPRFSNVHQRHFGYQAPPLNIVGAYNPINDDKTWSALPLE